MMKVLLFLALLVSVAAADDCMTQFHTCMTSNVAGSMPRCQLAFANCMRDSCECFDHVSGGVMACSQLNSTSAVQQCASHFQQDNALCISNCASNIPEIHSSKANVVRLFGLPSKCSICKSIVGWVEGKGNAYLCASMNLADVVPGCDLLGPVCGWVLDPVCSKLLSLAEHHLPLNPQNVCSDVGMCGGNIIDRDHTGHRVAAIVSVSKKGAAQFLKRHAKHANVYPSTAQCWEDPSMVKKGSKTRYICMEESAPVFAGQVSAASVATASQANAHQSSDMAIGVVIGVVAAVAAVGIVAAVVVIRRRRQTIDA